MADSNRKILNPPIKLEPVLEENGCSSLKDCDEFPRPPPPPPPPPPSSNSLSPYLILMFCALAVLFSLICIFTLSTKLRTFRSRFRRRSIFRRRDQETHEDFIDEDHFPVIHHPIWLINTIGLEQSVIESIEILKYKKGLIEGTDCSVCLSEFEDDESLRLLPKCSHAFHVPCIDTWLRSHKNCPLCRAPIVKNTTIADPLTTHEEIPVMNSENVNDLEQNQTNEVDFNQEVNTKDDFLEKNPTFMNLTTDKVRVQSVLVDRNREELQPMRRSVSMDMSSVSMVDFVAVNIYDHDQETCLGTKKQKSTKGEKHRESSSCISMCRVTKSSSFGRCSRKASTFMKRSYSSSDNKGSRNRSS